MDIELATTDDLLEELHRRSVHFIFAGVLNTNLRKNSVQYVCQAESRKEMLTLFAISIVASQQRATSMQPIDCETFLDF